VSKHI